MEEILGPIALFDWTFPHACSWETIRLGASPALALPASGDEEYFLRRFRSTGGHRALAAPGLSSKDAVQLEQVAGEGERLVVCVGSAEEFPAVASYLERRRHALLAPTHQRHLEKSKDWPRLRGYRTTRLIERSGGPSFFLLAPDQVMPERGSDRRVRSPDTELFDGDDNPIIVEASGLVHDGGYASEGDHQYSWLWTGPSSHFRLIPPHPAGRASRIELCVPRTEDRANLDRIAVQLNGRPVAHAVDRWSDTSGKIIIDLPESTLRPALTLVVPCMTADANSGRLLGVCIDKMIILQ
ncbi:MAG: hypothetical protein J0H41_10995 [Rhizobiales bacterium]|nr:hypothetical protein [Hyphomicrobiales bacterium]